MTRLYSFLNVLVSWKEPFSETAPFAVFFFTEEVLYLSTYVPNRRHHRRLIRSYRTVLVRLFSSLLHTYSYISYPFRAQQGSESSSIKTTLRKFPLQALNILQREGL